MRDGDASAVKRAWLGAERQTRWTGRTPLQRARRGAPVAAVVNNSNDGARRAVRAHCDGWIARSGAKEARAQPRDFSHRASHLRPLATRVEAKGGGGRRATAHLSSALQHGDRTVTWRHPHGRSHTRRCILCFRIEGTSALLPKGV